MDYVDYESAIGFCILDMADPSVMVVFGRVI